MWNKKTVWQLGRDQGLVELRPANEVTQREAIDYFMDKYNIKTLSELGRILSVADHKIKRIYDHEFYFSTDVASKFAFAFSKSDHWFKSLQGFVKKTYITQEEIDKYENEKT